MDHQGVETPADLAVTRGLITPAQRDQAHLMARTSGRPVGDVLVELGFLTVDAVRELAEFKQKFGRYELQKEVGRGGMGVVYKAWQPDLKRTVAIKIITSTSDEDLRRFHREAETAARLSHPNIAPIHEVGVEDGRPFIAMAFIDGRTLMKAELPLKSRVEALRDVARALHAAHQQGIIHRDVKPDNIMIDRGGRAFVTDFGLAKSIKPGSSLTLGGIVMGTPCYMSPEQAQGRTRAMNARSDVYSLGATLYEVLTGLPPFIAEDFMQVLMMVLKDEPEPPRDRRAGVPADLETICLKALQKNPARRYATAADFADDLDRWLKNEPILARRSGALSRATARLRRQPLLVAAGILLVAVGAISTWLIVRAQAKVTESAEESEREREAMKRARPMYDTGLGLLERAESLFLRDEAGSLDAAKGALAKFDEAVVTAPTFGDAWHARGRARALGRGDAKQVDADFAKAVELNPNSPRIHLDWALAVVRERLWAAEALIPAFYDDPQKPAIPSPIVAGIDVPDLREHRSTASRSLLEVARLATKPEERHFADGLAAQLSDNAVRAEPLFSRVLELDDRHFWARASRGFARVKLGRFKEALADLTPTVAEKPAFAKARAFRSVAAQYAGDWVAALDDVDWLLARETDSPEKARLTLRRGMLLKFAGRPDEAFTAFGQVDREEAVVFRARMLVAKGQMDAAVAELQKLLVKTPKSLAGHVELGLLHWRAGRLDDASRSLGEALAVGPSDPWPRYWLAKVSVAAGAPRRDLFEKFVSARLDKEAAHHESLAWLAILDGKPADAIGPLLKAQELAPADASLWSTLGRVHTMLKDDTAAFNAYYEAVKLQPSDYDARVQLSRYYLDRGLDDKADGELTVALSLRESAEAHYLRGVARRKLKRFEHARQDLEEAAKDPAWKSKADAELKLIR